MVLRLGPSGHNALVRRAKRFRPSALLAAALVAAVLVGACEAIGSPASAPSIPAATAPPPTATARAASPSPTGPTAPSPSKEPALGLAPTGPTETALVLRVIDGDTIEVDRGRGPEKVRYIGVDTPETVNPGSPVEWMGPEASAANRALVDGREVVLERDVSETDRYGRLLRYVWLHEGAAWTLVNLALVSTGYAAVVTYPPDVKYVDLYLAAQREAREAGRGLWGEPPASAPAATSAAGDGSCDPAYPEVCIAPPPPDLDCGDVPFRRFRVLALDPHRFDRDHDGIGCES